MVTQKDIQAQLAELGLRFKWFGRQEIKELANILNKGEKIRHCVYGYYQGGSALLVATNSRLLLIDKRPFFLNLEDIRYEMINEVNFAGRLLDSAVHLFTGNKDLSFRSYTDRRLRQLCTYVQDQITKARHMEHAIETAKPVSSAWRPYSLLPRPKVGKYVQIEKVQS